MGQASTVQGEEMNESEEEGTTVIVREKRGYLGRLGTEQGTASGGAALQFWIGPSRFGGSPGFHQRFCHSINEQIVSITPKIPIIPSIYMAAMASDIKSERESLKRLWGRSIEIANRKRFNLVFHDGQEGKISTFGREGSDESNIIKTEHGKRVSTFRPAARQQEGAICMTNPGKAEKYR